MRMLARLVAVVMVLMGSVAAAQAPPADQRLPADPALTAGTLANGLGYVVRPHRNPEGRVSVWLHVATGSLNETESTRGLAHYLEHMAFNGSTNFPPGSVVPFFQSLGLNFGRDQNAFTSFDQTVYQLALPDATPETLDKGMRFMADVAGGLLLLPNEVEAERQIILEEMRARSGVQQRVQDYLYERLAPESTVGRRLPIGTEATVKAMSAQDFRDYYARWYVPSNMTVIVVGDLDPATAVTAITRWFGGMPAVPRPQPVDPGVKASAGTRAIVAVDPELTRAGISIMRVEPTRPPTVSVAQKRVEIVEQLGSWMFNRRMSRELAAGSVAFTDASASARQWFKTLQVFSVDASGKPEAWPAMLTDLGIALQRARLHGFTAAELDEARTALLAEAEDAVQREATRPAPTVLRHINAKVARREPIVSAAQHLTLLKQLLPGLTAAEVSQAFAANFDPANAIFTAELPANANIPTEAALTAAGRAAVSVTPEKPAEIARATSLLATLPRAGTVVEKVEHAASGVTSARLDNGVRVHHRFMDQRRNEVTVTITLAGGVIQENPRSRGLTEAAAQAWDRPATSTLSSPQIETLMTGKNVRVRGSVGADALTLTVSGNPRDLETGLQLAHLLLTDPVIEAVALGQWKEREIQSIAARQREPWGVMEEAMSATLYPRDAVRLHPLSADQVRAVERAEAQAWLRTLIATAPIEVAVVGDLERDAALGLITTYLGSLPARDPISDKTLHGLRALGRPAGPIDVRRTVDAAAPQAAVLEGFFGADIQNVRDVRLLAAAARVLSSRMHKVIREDKQLVYSIGASSRPAYEYPGFGLFVAQAPTDPAKTDALARAVDEMYTTFAADGPTEDEMAVARKQLVNTIDQTLKNPDFWAARLATLDYRGTDLTELLRAKADYEQMQPAAVRDAFARYFVPSGKLRFVVVPAPRS
jgi:zinc protease